MACDAIQASAPGKLMLLGEHAVLHGHHALVAAVNQRLHVRLSSRDDRRLVIRSSLGTWETTIDDLTPNDWTSFILAAVRQRRVHLPRGLDLSVTSEFTPDVGLGSSAAVTAATITALDTWLGRSLDPHTLFEAGLAAIREVQGSGSGADLAASVHGGIVLYRAEPLLIESLHDIPPITVVYSGRKASTPEVIAQVTARERRQPALFEAVYRAIDAGVLAGREAIEQRDWAALGDIFRISQGLMAALGVSAPDLEEIAAELDRQPHIHGAKLSGAGLGDCLVAIGHLESPNFPYALLPLAITEKGVTIES